mgnify:CR=1 FL=1
MSKKATRKDIQKAFGESANAALEADQSNQNHKWRRFDIRDFIRIGILAKLNGCGIKRSLLVRVSKTLRRRKDGLNSGIMVEMLLIRQTGRSCSLKLDGSGVSLQTVPPQANHGNGLVVCIDDVIDSALKES